MYRILVYFGREFVIVRKIELECFGFGIFLDKNVVGEFFE